MHQLQDPGLCILPAEIGIVGLHDLKNLVTHGIYRAEGHKGVLEDHGDLFSPNGAQLLFAGLGQILSVKEYFSRFDTGIAFVDQTHQGPGHSGFSAAGFSHQAHHLTALNSKVHIVCGRHHPLLGVIVGF